MNPRVAHVQIESSHTLLVTFTNKEIKVFDVAPYLAYPVYEALRDENYFRRAKVFNGTVIWDDSTDFDPDTMYLEGKAKA